MTYKQDLEPLLNVQQSDLNLTISYGEQIDGKALAILAANIAIIIFIAQEGFLGNGWQYFLLYTPFAVSLVFDVLAIWPRRYLSGSVDLDENQYYLGMNRDDLVLQLLTDAVYATTHNGRLNRMRLRYGIISIIITGLGLAGLLVILHI